MCIAHALDPVPPVPVRKRLVSRLYIVGSSVAAFFCLRLCRMENRSQCIGVHDSSRSDYVEVKVQAEAEAEAEFEFESVASSSSASDSSESDDSDVSMASPTTTQQQEQQQPPSQPHPLPLTAPPAYALKIRRGNAKLLLTAAEEEYLLDGPEFNLGRQRVDSSQATHVVDEHGSREGASVVAGEAGEAWESWNDQND